MESDDTLSIQLSLAGHTLHLSVRRADEPLYRAAEQTLDERIRFYSSHYPGLGVEMHLMMSAIDVAVRLKTAERDACAEDLMESLQRLAEELEQTAD